MESMDQINMQYFDPVKFLPHHLGFDWGSYYIVIIWASVMQFVLTVSLVLSAFSALGRWLNRPDGAFLEVEQPIAIVIPCYLPNEASIIKGTIDHVMNKMDHLRNFTLYLVYNTPVDMPLEGELTAMADDKRWKPGRSLEVHRVNGSTSKAANLNYILPKITQEHLAVYDADHYPDPRSLALAVWHLRKKQTDCVQGSTYIRGGFCLPRFFVNAEFFTNYFVLLPAVQTFTGTAFFGGSNGVWRTSALQQVRFDEDVLTEDIECFARSITQHNFRFKFMPESCSGELLPANPKAFWSQRLRWAMGWDEVTLKHAGAFVRKELPLRTRVGLCYIFMCRWFTQFATVVIVFYNFRSAIQVLFSSPDEGSTAPSTPGCIHRLQVLSFFLYAGFIGYTFLLALLHCPFRVIPGLFIYFWILPFYILVNTVMLTISLFRVTTGKTGTWIVTQRADTAHDLIASKRRTDSLDSVGSIVQSNTCSGHVVFSASVALGATFGAIFGYFMGTHQVTNKLWGWVPFGIGATTSYVTDGAVVVKFIGLGMLAAGALAWTIIRRK